MGNYQGIEKFKYFVGIRSLADIATREDRVCVLNILGNESRAVAPDQPYLFPRQHRVRHLARAARRSP